jgi:hypothetical protein
MELIMQLREDNDPLLIDWETGKDVSNQVYCTEILPGGEGFAYLYAHNSEGMKFRDGDEVAKLPPVPIVKIYGKWVSRRSRLGKVGA